MDARQPHQPNGDMARGKPPKSSDLKKMVGRRFRAAAEAYEPSQAALARELEIAPQQLNGYLRGKNYPDEAVLVRFCNLSGCTMDWIFRGVFESSVPPEMAALIGLNYPDLIEIRDPKAVRRQALASSQAPEPAAAGRASAVGDQGGKAPEKRRRLEKSQV